MSESAAQPARPNRVALDAMGGDHAPGETVAGAVQAAREKRNASMLLALQQVRDGAALGGVSAGNSGAMMAAATIVLRRVKGVKRAALGGVLPTRSGVCMVIDMGANTDCKPEYLQQFALMGSIYMQNIFKIRAPRIGLLANGEEEGKGNLQVQETY